MDILDGEARPESMLPQCSQDVLAILRETLVLRVCNDGVPRMYIDQHEGSKVFVGLDSDSHGEYLCWKLLEVLYHAGDENREGRPGSARVLAHLRCG